MRKESSEFIAGSEHGPEFEFDNEHENILKRYGSDLPKAENDLSVVTVVPAYRELANGNFWLLLRALGRQQAPSDLFEVLYVVNNGRPESGEHLDQAGFLENQETLKIAKVYQKLLEVPAEQRVIPDDLTLSEQQKAIFFRALKKGVRFFVVDVSSPGRAFETTLSEKSGPGQARNIGGHLAYERLNQNGNESGLVDFLDADCFPRSSYYGHLLKEGLGKPAVVKILSPLSMEVPESIFEFQKAEEVLAKFTSFARYSYLLSRFIYQHDEYIRTHSGQVMAVSPKVFRLAGGYATDASDEDFIFAEHVASQVPQGLADTEANAWLSNRSRLESFDGKAYLAASSLFDLLPWVMSKNQAQRQDPLLKSKTVDRSVQEIIIIDRQASSDPVYVELRKKIGREEKLRRAASKKILGRVLEKFFESQLAQEYKDNLLKDFENGDIDLPPVYRLFFSGKNLKRLAEVAANFCNETDAGFSFLNPSQKSIFMVRMFARILPEYFDDSRIGPTEPDDPDLAKIAYLPLAQNLYKARKGVKKEKGVNWC